MEAVELMAYLDSIIGFLTSLLDETSEISGMLPGEIPGTGIVDARLFLTTPLNDYTVTEGLLLVIVLMLFMGFLFKLWEKVYG